MGILIFVEKVPRQEVKCFSILSSSMWQTLMSHLMRWVWILDLMSVSARPPSAYGSFITLRVVCALPPCHIVLKMTSSRFFIWGVVRFITSVLYQSLERTYVFITLTVPFIDRYFECQNFRLLCMMSRTASVFSLSK